jgi:hypothetical protein
MTTNETGHIYTCSREITTDRIFHDPCCSFTHVAAILEDSCANIDNDVESALESL